MNLFTITEITEKALSTKTLIENVSHLPIDWVSTQDAIMFMGYEFISWFSLTLAFYFFKKHETILLYVNCIFHIVNTIYHNVQLGLPIYAGIFWSALELGLIILHEFKHKNVH